MAGVPTPVKGGPPVTCGVGFGPGGVLEARTGCWDFTRSAETGRLRTFQQGLKLHSNASIASTYVES